MICTKTVVAALALVAATCAGCGSDNASAGQPSPTEAGTQDSGSAGSGGAGGTGGNAGSPGPGHVTYLVGGALFLAEATDGATPTNLSDELDVISSGAEHNGNLSPDGNWLLLLTTRFGCEDWECLVVVDRQLGNPSIVKPGAGDVVHGETAAVASGGKVVVYEAESGPHDLDLYVTRRQGDAWSAAQLLTGDSPLPYNRQPAWSDDGSKIAFDCGESAYSQELTSICEVAADGSGLRVVVGPDDDPDGATGGRVHSPDYAPDGSLVFEGEWDREELYRLSPGDSVPALIGEGYDNDNTPCVLPDGRIVSFWLNAPGNVEGNHEVKVMGADGAAYFMLMSGADGYDNTLGCGR